MSSDQLVQLLQDVLTALPNVTVNLPKKKMADWAMRWNAMIFSVFSNVIEAIDVMSIEKQMEKAIVDIMGKLSSFSQCVNSW